MSNGEPVTDGSVSELCGILDKPALVPWAAKKVAESVAEYWKPGIAYDAQHIELAIMDAKKAPMRAKDTAGDIGTRAHLIVGAYVEGQLKPEHIEDPRERRCLENFIRVTEGWEWLGSEITLVNEWSECKCRVHQRDENDAYARIVGAVCPDCGGVYRLCGYGGTADAIARINGVVHMIDFKTSNSVQATYTLQCALYAAAQPVGDGIPLRAVWKEIKEARILHFDKTLLTWESLERNIQEQYEYIPHFIWCRRWKKRFEQKSYSTYGDKKVEVTPVAVSISSQAPAASVEVRPPAAEVWIG